MATVESPAEVWLPFAADSAIRQVCGEGILLLGGGRALLMQLAHPAIARAVYEHSNFREDRLGRLLRTLRPTMAMVFGTREQALAAAATINRRHESVAGDGYDARDPDLLMWVLATLIDTTLVMHELFVGPLAPSQAQAYYGEMKLVGAALGIPKPQMPIDLVAFQRYVEDTTTTLHVSDEARGLAEALFRTDLSPWAVMWPLRQLTAGLMPPELRTQYGMNWGPGRETGLRTFAAKSRAVLPWLPRSWRRPPGFLLPP